MATIYYIRKRSQQGSISSTREISVDDLVSLYGSAPGNYEYIKDVDSAAIAQGRGPAAQAGDPAQVVVRIEGEEAGRAPFSEQGFYRVRDARV